MGPSINNLVAAIHDGHLKKKQSRSLALLAQIYMLLDNLCLDQKSLRMRLRKFVIHEHCDFEGYF